NRDNSSDSRYWGFVPRDAIVGEPLFVYWSLKNPPVENDASSVPQQLVNLGKTLLDIPFLTRWNRIFHEVR
ncbi:MAG: S26 family signal peptidase, partial [Candidatus Acidiferrales bacterium]